MKTRSTINGLLMLLIIAGLSFAHSCKKIPEETRIINNWIYDGMNEVYLWEADIPDLDPDKQADPEAFFYNLLYVDDYWSWITDDYESLVNSFNGIELSTGIYPVFGLVGSDSSVIMVVAYVDAGSPAELAGIERGDIVYAINNEQLNIHNYIDLYYSETATYSLADYVPGSIVPNGTTVEITAAVVDANPILHSEIIEYQGKKIGYLAYGQFTAGTVGKWLDSLNNVLFKFQSNLVDDVVIDLRYNPGGAVDVAQSLASALAPASVMNNKEILMNLNWNDLYQNYWRITYGSNSEYLVVRFIDSEYNMDLDRVYFLTTDRSASACELVISGLDPWTNVVHIGENTYGKYTGSITVHDTEDPPRHNWAMQPIVFKYSNVEGYTDFIDGLTPDYQVEDNLLEAVPFGDISDPQLSKALELITGVAPTKKSAKVAEPMRILPNPKLNRKVSEINSITLPVLKD